LFPRIALLPLMERRRRRAAVRIIFMIMTSLVFLSCWWLSCDVCHWREVCAGHAFRADFKIIYILRSYIQFNVNGIFLASRYYNETQRICRCDRCLAVVCRWMNWSRRWLKRFLDGNFIVHNNMEYSEVVEGIFWPTQEVRRNNKGAALCWHVS
jgi:hypothetical protein